MISRHALAAVVMATGLLLSSAAQAQSYLRPLNADGIGRAEWNRMSASSKNLYHPTIKEEGAVESWTTPGGAKGTVTLEKVENRADGSPCVVLLHEVTAPASTQPHAARVRKCLQANGAWLVSVE